MCALGYVYLNIHAETILLYSDSTLVAILGNTSPKYKGNLSVNYIFILFTIGGVHNTLWKTNIKQQSMQYMIYNKG